MPQVLLRVGATGQPEVVLLDWADCAVAPLGAELNALVGTSSLVFGWPPAQARQLDQIVFARYLDGLAASGWAGDARVDIGAYERGIFRVLLPPMRGCLQSPLYHQDTKAPRVRRERIRREACWLGALVVTSQTAC